MSQIPCCISHPVQPIPGNVFVIGACNPHRGNSLALSETWVRGSYQVEELHPTLYFLKWDYGCLTSEQVKEYVRVKLAMMDNIMPNLEACNLSELIAESQELIQSYAHHHYMQCGNDGEMADKCSKSCVSQRDIQRVFTFYAWITEVYKKLKPHGHKVEEEEYRRRALLVALGIVYYLRLPTDVRERYMNEVDSMEISNEIRFATAFETELNWYIDSVELPDGIAKTQALKENLFAIIACACTSTPLIVVGTPGSSKTLSFHIAANNLSGAESPREPFRNTTVFPSLDPYFYQCSRNTRAHEINTVFSKAIKRQKSHKEFALPINCVVFMDEAGLPPESQQPLKALHHHLDQPEVSFVAISNTLLDAAKTNRAVSLVRPETTLEELKLLASGCLKASPVHASVFPYKIEKFLMLCRVYQTLMKDKERQHFFGLRDFIHLFHYIRHHCHKGLPMSDLLLRGLERNFSGTEDFPDVCRNFLMALLNEVLTCLYLLAEVLMACQNY